MNKDPPLQFSSCPMLYVVWLFLCLLTVQAQDGKVTCSVPPVEEFHDTVLTCHFPEDLSVSKKDFTVYHYVPGNDPDAVLDCWWLRGVVDCYIHPDFVYNNIVSRTLSITARHVTTNHTGSYACQIANYDASLLEKCELSLKPVSEHVEEKISSNLLIILISSLLSLAVVASVSFYLIFRWKLLSHFFLRRRRQTPDDEHNKEDNEVMLKKKEEQTLNRYLEKNVRKMYPDTLNSCYFVPPIYFNKYRLKIDSVAPTYVNVYESCNPNEVQYDRAMQHVLHCLRHVGEQSHEQMFVLTQFKYEDFLHTVSRDHSSHSVTRITEEEEKNIKCFDILIIHRKLGFIAVVVKTVSDSPGKEQRDKQTSDGIVMTHYKEATSQLKKAGDMIHRLMSDETEFPEVRLVLILPNLSSSSLVPAVTSHADQVKLLCADDLPDSKSNFDVRAEQTQKLLLWWDQLKESTQGNTMMSDELYAKAISRFCGPATQSHLENENSFLVPKTLAEAVLITGTLYERHILHPHMFDLLKEERLILVGPPNTGKTRMLMLAAEKWKASDLYVISGKRTQSSFLRQLPAHHIECDFNNKKEVKETARMLCEKKDHNTLCVLAYNVSGQHFKTFCTLLTQNIRYIRMWATARIMKDEQVPTGWRLVTLTHALTCPPAVVRAAVGAGYTIPGADNKSLDYLPPTDGPPVKYFCHKRDQGNVSHDCTQCGENVAVSQTSYHYLRQQRQHIAGRVQGCLSKGQHGEFVFNITRQGCVGLV